LLIFFTEFWMFHCWEFCHIYYFTKIFLNRFTHYSVVLKLPFLSKVTRLRLQSQLQEVGLNGSFLSRFSPSWQLVTYFFLVCEEIKITL
jgi:hypothetical protein